MIHICITGLFHYLCWTALVYKFHFATKLGQGRNFSVKTGPEDTCHFNDKTFYLLFYVSFHLCPLTETPYLVRSMTPSITIDYDVLRSRLSLRSFFGYQHSAQPLSYFDIRYETPYYVRSMTLSITIDYDVLRSRLSLRSCFGYQHSAKPLSYFDIR